MIMADYRLKYTGAEIEERLDKVDELEDAKVVIGNEEPTEGTLWIKPEGSKEIILAEIDDAEVSNEKTWSSNKIENQISNEIEEHKNNEGHITSAERASWNAKSNFSGNYNDLNNKPTIPSKTSQLTNDSGYITKAPVEVAVQSGTPSEGTLWVDTDEDEEVILAEIDDNAIDTEKTWSSNKINEEVTELNEKIVKETGQLYSDIECIGFYNSEQLLKHGTKEDGVYWRLYGTDNFTKASHEEYRLYQSITVKKGRYYFSAGLNPTFTYFLDSDGTYTNWLTKYSSQEGAYRENSFIDIDSDYTLYISYHMKYAKNDYPMFCRGVLPYEYFEGKVEDKKDADKTDTTFLVAKNGGDFNTIGEALAKSDNHQTIILFGGTYEERLNTADNTYGNKGKTKSIIGVDKSKCKVVNYNSGYAEDTLWVSGGYYKNLSLYSYAEEGATTGGYALHADSGWLINGTVIFENCYFYAEMVSAIGIGARPNCNIIFRNCIFESDTTNGRGAVFFHNSADTSSQGNNQRITFENCEIHSKNGCAIGIQRVGDDNNTIELTINRCLIYSDELGTDNVISIDDTLYTGTSGNNINVTNKTFGNNVNVADYFV